MATKLIYGVGRVPKASEFTLGDIVVNVDDSKVYSKNKSNVVFEIGAGSTTTINQSTTAFSSASLHTGSFNAILTASNSSNLTISGGIGIEITTGSQVNSIILNATGESISNVQIADTASYVAVSNIDGTIDISSQTNLTVEDTDGQTGINLTLGSDDTLSALVTGLRPEDNVQFTDITASGDISASRSLFASASEETIGGDNIRVVVYDTGSGKFYYTGSYGGSGGKDDDWYLDTGNNSLTSSRDVFVTGDISASGDIYAEGFISSSGGFIFEPGTSQIPALRFNNAGNLSTGIYSPAPTNISIQAGGGDAELQISSDGALARTARFDLRGSLTASNDISASGDIIAKNITSSAYIKATTAVTSPRFERNNTNYLSFTEAGSNTLRFVANGTKVLDFKNSILHVNPLNANIDFRVDGDTNDFLLVADATLENIGIGTSASNGINLIPEKLTVSGSISASGDLIVEQDIFTTGSVTITKYLKLNATGSNIAVSAVAGALMYSASDDFYLGFSG